MLTLLLAVCGATVGFGLWLLVGCLRGTVRLPNRTVGGHSPIPAGWAAGLAAAGLLLAAVTRLPALGLIVAALGYVVVEERRGPSVATVTRLGEAIAAWAEVVREGLDAGQHLRAAIVASCHLPPDGLAEPLARLAVRLDTTPLPDALWGLRAEVPHPAIGPVIAGLDVAYRRGAGDLPRLMAGQVEATRGRVALLRDEHAVRAKHRRAMLLLLGLFAGSAAALLIAWPAFFSPYRTVTGQLVLAGLGAAVVMAVRALTRMGTPEIPPDFFPAPPSGART